MQRPVDEFMDQPAIAKAHFVLGRMHVDVDPARIELQEQYEGGMPAVEQHVRIGLAHRVGVMRSGKLVEQGSAEQILTRPQHPYTQALLSSVPRDVPGIDHA